MPFDSLYLNPRRVIRHPMTGEIVVCSGDDGEQHDPSHTDISADWCDECGATVLVCDNCQRCVSCCPCGAYHSTDCFWPL